MDIRAREVAQKLRLNTDLVEDPGSVSSTHRSRGSAGLFGHLHSNAFSTHTHPQIHTIKEINVRVFNLVYGVIS